MSTTLNIVIIVALLIQLNGAVTDCYNSDGISQCGPDLGTKLSREWLKQEVPRKKSSTLEIEGDQFKVAGKKLEKTSESEKPKHIVYSQKTTCGAAIKRCICGD
uniref:Pectate lyase n=1 Tax=Spongospora subterranea TaxID=70186 RepID=A0A0H5QG66_9EUKA|eukprot:CRZ01048.1 hypothetical protein [Spongospora subterranea]